MLLSPALVILTLVLTALNKEGPFFIQQRPGKDGKLFKLVKFRTMSTAQDKQGKLLSDTLRLTRFGSILRKSSLDEIPQLLNVLKGDMSLIGPRPLLVEYLPLYNKEQQRRHEILPGITGWAQVNGRNLLTWEEKFQHDIWYLDNISVWLDVKIFFLTVKKVFLSVGVNQSNKVTATPFTKK